MAVAEQGLRVPASRWGASVCTLATIPSPGGIGDRIYVSDDGGGAWYISLDGLSFVKSAPGLNEAPQPWHMMVSGFEVPDATPQNAWAGVVAGAYWHSMTRYNLTPALNDELAYDFPLLAGVYNLTVVHWQASDEGQVTVKVGATTLSPVIDCYAASTSTSVADTFTGITIAASGKYRVSMKVTGKNASSSSYTLAFMGLIWRRTA